MKHSYQADCSCPRCTKERTRRAAQGFNHGPDPFRRTTQQVVYKRRRTRTSDRRPVHGSAEWAETRGDDIPSYDQPGDDFDTY